MFNIVRYVVNEMINDLLKNALDSVGLEVNHCTGNATDGAANMKGLTMDSLLDLVM